MVQIREYTDSDWPSIWPVWRQVVAAGDRVGQCHRVLHRLALLRRQPDVVVVQLREFPRDALQPREKRTFDAPAPLVRAHGLVEPGRPAGDGAGQVAAALQLLGHPEARHHEPQVAGHRRLTDLRAEDPLLDGQAQINRPPEQPAGAATEPARE